MKATIEQKKADENVLRLAEDQRVCYWILLWIELVI